MSRVLKSRSDTPGGAPGISRLSWRDLKRVALGLCLVGLVAIVLLVSYVKDNLYKVQLTAADPVRSNVVVAFGQRVETLRLLGDVGHRLRRQARSNVEFVELVTDWVHWNVRPQDAAPSDIISDGPFGALVRGHAYCDQVAGIAAIIFWTQGYDVRLFALIDNAGDSPHTVMEVWIDGKWAVVDPWSGAPFTRDGALHSVAQIDEGLLDYWGVNQFPAAYYRQGRPWRVFPFLTFNDITDRFRSRPAPPIPERPGRTEIRQRTATLLPTRSTRKAFVEARLAELRGEDARPLYDAIEPRLADPELRGGVQFAVLRESASRGDALPAATPEGSWAPSKDALFARAGLDPAVLQNERVPAPHRMTIARLLADGTPSVFRSYAPIQALGGGSTRPVGEASR